MQQIDRYEKDWRVQRWPPPTPNASCEFYVIEMHRRVITNFYGLGRNRLPNFLVTSPVSYEPYWRPGNFHGFQQTVQTVNIYISPTWGWGQTDTMTFTDPPSDEVSNNQQINCFICFSSDMIFENIYIKSPISVSPSSYRTWFPPPPTKWHQPLDGKIARVRSFQRVS
jgi:hypothetical protein